VLVQIAQCVTAEGMTLVTDKDSAHQFFSGAPLMIDPRTTCMLVCDLQATGAILRIPWALQMAGQPDAARAWSVHRGRRRGGRGTGVLFAPSPVPFNVLF
jgi:hypothetical protein